MRNALALCLALPLLLVATPKAGHAQPASGPFTDVPKTDRAYQDLAVLHNAGATDAAGVRQEQGSFFFSRGGQGTRYDFASLTADILDVLEGVPISEYALPDVAGLQRTLAQDPPAVAALRNLAAEFQPELARLGVDLTAASLRLNALAQGQTLPITRPFPDVPKDHWAFASVEALRKAGIVTGLPAGHGK